MTWMETTIGFVLCVCLALCLGVALGWLTIYFKIVKLSMYLLGGFAGFFVGAFLFTLGLAMFSWELESWVMIATAVFFALIGVLLAWQFGDGICIISTAIIGSYLFMKGLADFLGNYPDF